MAIAQRDCRAVARLSETPAAEIEAPFKIQSLLYSSLRPFPSFFPPSDLSSPFPVLPSPPLRPLEIQLEGMRERCKTTLWPHKKAIRWPNLSYLPCSVTQ